MSVAGDDVSVKCTPLHMAAYHGHLEVGKVLIRANSDIHATQCPPSTVQKSPSVCAKEPLSFALSKKHTLGICRIIIVCRFQAGAGTLRSTSQVRKNRTLSQGS